MRYVACGVRTAPFLRWVRVCEGFGSKTLSLSVHCARWRPLVELTILQFMTLTYRVHPRETFYFFLQLVITLVAYAIFFVVVLSYLAFISACMVMFFFVLSMLLLYGVCILVAGGYVKGRAVRVSPNQFKEIFHMVEEQSGVLGLRKAPRVYVWQPGGLVDALARKVIRRHYVVLLAPVVVEAYGEGEDTLRFIVGHTLGHVQRNGHGFWKLLFTLVGKCIPLLGAAYSRACEYTCDRIAYALAPKDAMRAMALLALGAPLYRVLDEQAWIREGEEALGFATWFTELWSCQPYWIKRVKALYELQGGKR